MTIDSLDHNLLDRQCEEMSELLTKHIAHRGDGFHGTAIDKLEFQQTSSTVTTLHGVSEPIVSIIVRGRKQLCLGNETYVHDQAQYLVLSVALPLSGCILDATPERPYLAAILKLDPAALCELIAATSLMPSDRSDSVRGLFVGTADVALLDCVLRLTRLLDTPQDIAIVAPLIIREIYYRLLVGEQGEAVRQLATSGSNMQRIAAAIESIKTDPYKPLRVEDLARQATMSSSSFHHHFKQVTAMSPIQYQKHLRLLAARRLLLVEDCDLTHAAERVGYESRSHFSREYARMFGAPPIIDIKRLRSTQAS
jgi:AraC-like DNA-binding protein